LQSEVSQLSPLQKLFERLNILNLPEDEQKSHILQNWSSQVKDEVSDKDERKLLNDFARGPPAAKDKKGKDKKETVSEPVSQQPPVSSVPVHESPSSASTAAAQPAPPTAPPGDSRAPAVDCPHVRFTNHCIF
jgi:hypothetical protein